MRTGILALVLACTLGACAVPATPPPAATSAPTGSLPAAAPPPIEVRVRGTSVLVHCFGAGAPVVVFENALGAPWSYWYPVYSQLQSTVRVCLQDGSDKARTSREKAEDLHTLLAGARLPPPYILVGHSFGGLAVILYANRYPEDVAGIVLEDSSHPDQGRRWLAALPPESPSENPDLAQLRKQFAQWTTPGTPIAGLDVAASFAEARAVTSLTDIPLVVLVHSPAHFDWGAIPPDVSARLEQAGQEMQQELAALSSNSTQVIATTSSHTIHRDEPQLVVDEILKLVRAARTRSQ